MSSGDKFVDVDLSDSSSSDDSDLDELLQDDEMEATMLVLSVKELEDCSRNILFFSFGYRLCSAPAIFRPVNTISVH
jgi:hypothetical protein